MEKNGLKDMKNHLEFLGGSPFLSGKSWVPSKFDLEKVFMTEPASALYILLNYKFEGLKLPLSNEAPPSYDGLKKMDLWGSPYDNEYYNDIKEMLEEVENLYLLDTDKKEEAKSKIKAAVDRAIAFRKVMN